MPLSFSNKEEARHPWIALHILPISYREAYFVHSLKVRMWFSWLPVQFYFPLIMLAMLVFLQTFSCLKTFLKKFYHPIKARLISSKRGKPQQPVLENHTYHLPLLSWTAITQLNPLVTRALFRHQAADSSVHYVEQLAPRQLCCQHMMNHPLSLTFSAQDESWAFHASQTTTVSTEGENGFWE